MSTQDTQIQNDTEAPDGEIIASGIIEAGTLTQYIEAFTPLVSEAKVHFNDDGFEVRVVDSANVCTINPGTLDKTAFESFDSPGSATIGVPLEKLLDRLDMAGGDDLVYLAVDMETRRLRVKYGRANQTLALIDPQRIRKEPSKPELDLPNWFTIDGGTLSEAVKFADMVSDHVDLIGEPDNERVVIFAEGDVDDMEYVLEGDDIIAGHIDADAMSIFSLDYIKEIAKPIPDDSEVTIQFGDEFPLKLAWSACDDAVSVDVALAPRIQSR